MWSLSDDELAREYCNICDTVAWRHYRIIDGKVVNFCELCGHCRDTSFGLEITK